jgi:cyclophilin family peptidyl-prolyl cis-trans isomerase
MMLRTILATLLLALMPATARAQEQPAAPPPPPVAVEAPAAPEAAAAPAPETAPPPAAPAFDPNQLVLAIEVSSGGTVRILMRPDKAPGHVARVQQLTSQGFYNGTIFHRVIPGFMAQGGDPTGTGQGGSPLPDLKAEFNDLMHFRGVTAMARSQSVDSANSQFFIMLMPNFDLDGKYTPWGRVISGMDAVDGIAVGEPPESPTRIVRAWLEPTPPAAPQTADATPSK